MIRTWLAGLALSMSATAAMADPCEAIPETGSTPAYLSFGSRFSGPVVHVIDGDSLCVAVGEGADRWVEVRLADFSAPEASAPGGAAAKAQLERLALGARATCTANMRTYDRIAARCTIGGASIGDRMRAAGVREGGNGHHGSAPITRGLYSAPAYSVGSGGFRSCAAARAAGVAPMRRGSPSYNPNLDRDGDGIACEPYRGQ